MAARLQVFDPPMCCPTGVCGPSVDPELVRFAADLKWIEERGVVVERHNLAHEPKAFVENPAVLAALNVDGAECLPLVIVDGQLVRTLNGYPSRQHLLDLLGLQDGE